MPNPSGAVMNQRQSRLLLYCRGKFNEYMLSIASYDRFRNVSKKEIQRSNDYCFPQNTHYANTHRDTHARTHIQTHTHVCTHTRHKCTNYKPNVLLNWLLLHAHWLLIMNAPFSTHLFIYLFIYLFISFVCLFVCLYIY